MEPHTAKNLKERKDNKLKDFVHVAGPLGAYKTSAYVHSLAPFDFSPSLGLPWQLLRTVALGSPVRHRAASTRMRHLASKNSIHSPEPPGPHHLLPQE